MSLTSDRNTAPHPLPALRAIPRTVIALGFVSLFMDTSSEIIHGLLPAFLVTVLGANAFSVGFIEGVSEATVSVAKVFSGAISDWIANASSWCCSGTVSPR